MSCVFRPLKFDSWLHFRFAGLANDIGNLVFIGLYFGNKEDPQQDEENSTSLVLEAWFV